MGKKTTNVNNKGTVGKQDNNDKNNKGTVTNVNNGGVVGIQAGNVDGQSVVIVNGKRVR